MNNIPEYYKIDEKDFRLALEYFVKIEPEKFKVIKYDYDDTGEIMEIPEFGGIVWDKKDANHKVFLITQEKAIQYINGNR